ncbi:MAG TPA: PD-(D/E)XK nuclease family protein [Gammaproteobacteria bacterium]
MIVHFGLRLDGMQPAAPVTAAGEVALGPARWLDVLEQQLGLPPAAARPAEALLAYRACLEDLDGPARFYHRSFAVDPIGVASTLLQWRAEWYEAGWDGRFDSSVSRRLGDLADVERLARERVPPTPGQRLRRIAAALDGGLVTQVRRVVLHDEPESMPAAWRRVLAHFDCQTAPGVALRANAAEGTDLFAIQQALLAVEASGDGGAPEPIELAGDSSLVVVRGVSRDLSAQALGEYLRKTKAPDETVVIAERDGIIVDNALERVGLPRAGFQHYSRFRAVTQVLKLCLGLVWRPVDAELLLEFLLHPVGPLPRRVRSALAAAVAGAPGVGGRAWQEALEKIAERERRANAPAPAAPAEARQDGPAGAWVQLEADFGEAAAERIDRLMADIRYWLACERFAPSEGAPIGVLVERTQRCATWLARRLGAASGGEADLYAAAHAQSEALIAALASRAARGVRRIPRLELERLVDEVAGHSPDPATFAEAGHVRAATDPAAITATWPTVIWWDLAPTPARVGYPWSRAELDELAAHGVALPAPEETIRARTREWLRPILNARSQLILAVHDRDEGHHPIWSRLTSLARGFNEVRIEDILLGGARGPAIPAIGVETEALEVKPLPGKRRWWHLPPGCPIPRRDAESYSSLSKLAYHPHQWVLRYAARLAPGRAASLASGPLLYGNLAHRLFESYFDAFPELPPALSADEESRVRLWIGRTLPRIIAQEGAVLDGRGMGVTREQVVTTLEDALLALLRHLVEAGVARAAAEQWLDVALPAAGGDARLCGAIDLLLTDRRGREIVLDVKWSNLERRGRELAENRALQLATYAYMRKTDGAVGRWPEQAYFIVRSGDVVARDTRVFPSAVPYPAEAPESIEQVWMRLAATCDWRRAQLERGAIEVNAAGTEPDDASAPPEGALATHEAEPDGYDEFARLTGWEPGE